jgi:glyoxylate reductase
MAPTRENARRMARCFVTRQLPGGALGRLSAAHDVDIWPQRLPPPPVELRGHAAEVEGLLTMLTDRVDDELIAACPRLEAISNYAVGYDNIDIDSALRRGIQVGNTPDVLTETTADHAFALLLAAARRLPDAIDSVRAGDWVTWEPSRYLGYDAHGATLGIIGMGRIGRAVARRAEGFEMTVVHTRAMPVDELLRASDFVSLHVPLTAETHHLIDARALALMRPTAILVNTARGPIVDQAALRQALIEGEIAGAALDVTDPEPLPKDDPLLSAPNLIVTPHIASATHFARGQMADLAVDNLLAALNGRPMPHPVS